ncbi:hypothetical protein [Pseudovibrio brasiliensis]|uniref:Sarcosine oxidase, gamma subunit family n=1 Tax=Pseudovibrio brasiliensis TaxID=1898042 RepID=A0ABX8AN75_9HYPH|nr:hypothetical protein [Pseudovibrio brasiliensis]QUS56540.1 hypothetical protein KGB56_03630 [Pseudovibrio brasiliensis]
MASAQNIHPDQALARSPFYRKLAANDAQFAQQGEYVVASGLSKVTYDASGVNFCDLSGLSRSGFKGNGTTHWLTSKGLCVPARPNIAEPQADGTLLCRLSEDEYLLLAPLQAQASTIADLETAWPVDHAASDKGIGYPLPRQDTHSWIYLNGTQTAAMFAKICGVDLRAEMFANKEIAQTVAARLGAIIIRDDLGGQLGFHFLTDSASAAYVWEVLEDATAEFAGGPLGLEDLLTALR